MVVAAGSEPGFFGAPSADRLRNLHYRSRRSRQRVEEGVLTPGGGPFLPLLPVSEDGGGRPASSSVMWQDGGATTGPRCPVTHCTASGATPVSGDQLLTVASALRRERLE